MNVQRFISIISRAVTVIGLLCSMTMFAAASGESVLPKQWPDVAGRIHPVAGKPVVLAWSGMGCPMSKLYRPRLERLAAVYKARGVRFFLVNSNSQDTPDELKRLAAVVRFPVIRDAGGRLARGLKVERTTEVLLFNGKGQVAYRGAVDDQYGFKKTRSGGVGAFRRPVPTVNYLQQAIEAVLAGNPVQVAKTEPYGCAIGLEEPAKERGVTFHEDVEPVLQVHCQECHHAGGGGPFALETYKQAKGWAKMIVEVTSEKRMPPWNADPQVGHFKNARGLAADEIQLLADWFKSGAPQGNPQAAPPRLDWSGGLGIGQPDHEIALPAFDVPAEGRVPYRYVSIPPQFKEDRWIRAAEFTSDTPEVVHHVLTFLHERSGGRRQAGRPWSPPFDMLAPLQGARPREFLYWIARNRRYLKQYQVGQGGGLHGYFLSGIVGDRPLVYPANRAKLLPAGATIVFQVHYNPNGKPHQSTSRLRLWFADKRPEQAVDMHAASTVVFRIPPEAPNHRVTAVHRFQRDGLLLGLQPHMHYRGKSFRYIAEYPDGRKETLLQVPDFDFNWQHKYELSEPRWLPRGTVLRAEGTFDNSPGNPDNPDPKRSVYFGLQSDEEMFIGYFEVIWNAPEPKD